MPKVILQNSACIGLSGDVGCGLNDLLYADILEFVFDILF